MEKIEKDLSDLYEEYAQNFTDRALVFGDGKFGVSIMLIGEAPGKDEIAQGKPFVGKAGKNLNEFLESINLNRTDIFITNVIKYKLFKVNPISGRESNRPALREEIESSISYLHREINIISPQIIVTLGNVPLRAVLNDFSPKSTIGLAHGRIRDAVINSEKYFLYPLYHPASIIYNQSLKSVYSDDVRNLKNEIDILTLNNDGGIII